MLESQQFLLPLLSLRATEDPRNEHDFTLNQFNVIVAPNGGSVDISTLHFYTFNPAFIEGLPPALRAHSAEWLRAQAIASSNCRIRLLAVMEFLQAACTHRIATRSPGIS